MWEQKTLKCNVRKDMQTTNLRRKNLHHGTNKLVSWEVTILLFFSLPEKTPKKNFGECLYFYWLIAQWGEGISKCAVQVRSFSDITLYSKPTLTDWPQKLFLHKKKLCSYILSKLPSKSESQENNYYYFFFQIKSHLKHFIKHGFAFQ